MLEITLQRSLSKFLHYQSWLSFNHILTSFLTVVVVGSSVWLWLSFLVAFWCDIPAVTSVCLLYVQFVVLSVRLRI